MLFFHFINIGFNYYLINSLLSNFVICNYNTYSFSVEKIVEKILCVLRAQMYIVDFEKMPRDEGQSLNRQCITLRS
jgi:hypothetical protein